MSTTSTTTTGRNLIIFIQNPGPLIITSYHTETQQLSECIIPFNILQIFKTLRSSINLSHVKAIAFILNGTDFPSFSAAYNFRQKCHEFCQTFGIFFVFLPTLAIQASMALCQSQMIVKNGEEILIFSFSVHGVLYGCRVIRKEYQYQIKYDLQTPSFNLDQLWKAVVLGTPKPSKIILIQQLIDPLGYMASLGNFLKDENPILLSPDPSAWKKAIIDTVMHLMEEKKNQFIVAPPCTYGFFVCYENVPLFQNIGPEPLPLEKSAVIEVDKTKFVSLVGKATANIAFDELLQDVSLASFKSKKAKITLKVDADSFYDFKVEEVADEKLVDEKEAKLPTNYFVSFDSKPVTTTTKPEAQIWFTQDDYFLVLEGLENDYARTPIYISFAEANPCIGIRAKEISETKPEYVVYDIIKLNSHSSLIFVNPKWKFSLSKESETLMVTVETFEGKKQASTHFLLAMVIKDAINKIHAQVGKKLDEFKIGFEGFVPNKVLKKNFETAAKRLKIKIGFC